MARLSFQLACERDLEGMDNKHRRSRYSTRNHTPAWVTIRTRYYSQLVGRDELFEPGTRRNRVRIGWDVCARAAASGVLPLLLP